MSKRERRPQNDDSLHNAQNNPPGSDQAHTDSDDIWSEEEVERASMGWRAEDEQREPDVPDNGAHVGDLEADTEDLEDVLDSAADALTDMGAREMRRDQYHRTWGDDLNPGFDSDIDANAPKEDDMPRKKTAGSRGQSDWH